MFGTWLKNAVKLLNGGTRGRLGCNMNERKCKACKQVLPVERFAGKWSRCRECVRGIDKQRWAAGKLNIKTPALAEHKRRWHRLNSDPIKSAARYAVYSAIAQGLLTVPEICTKCGLMPKPCSDGRRALQAHHHNGYEAQLDIIWLCPPCHKLEHVAQKERGIHECV